MPSETIGKTVRVAAGVCIFCSVFVATAAIFLKPVQEVNKTLDRNRNILIAAGLWNDKEAVDVERIFREKIETKWVNLETGEFVSEDEEAKIAAEYGDEKKASTNKDLSSEIVARDDVAGIKRKADYREIYMTTKEGRIERLILPVYGRGLWSTMYGFLALGSDLTTIESFGFYEHEETPGLGGEIDNPRWKELWVGKRAFDKDGNPAIKVVKGTADRENPFEVDGLSGATLTSRGVGYLVQFWLGDEGFGPLLKKLKEGEGHGQT